MRVRLRAPGGASTLTLNDDATVADLKTEITKATSLTQFDIKYNYPPKPLNLPSDTTLLSDIPVKLNGEQLTISEAAPRSPPAAAKAETRQAATPSSAPGHVEVATTSDPKFAGIQNAYIQDSKASKNAQKPIALNKEKMAEDTPEVPLPDRGATLVVRVMPDDNSCLFRAFAAAVLPGDDLTMHELRSLVASQIQVDPETWSEVILERKPDDYCRWLQTDDAWGGAIEMTILSKHFEIEICSIDVQSLRVDRFNEGAPNRCILVYSGIHYDTIAQSPSDPPHTRADFPPEMDKKIWDKDDDNILIKAQELCKKLQDQHYFTDTGGMAIKCKVCGWIGYGEGQAATHAQMSGHYDMEEQT